VRATETEALGTLRVVFTFGELCVQTVEEHVIPISVAVYALIIFKFHRSGYLQAKAKSEKAAKSAKEVKKVKVSLINMKRAQNAGIALARIRYSYSELRQKIQVRADELWLYVTERSC
jgi:hypothetical protein